MNISVLGTGRMGRGLMKVLTPHVQGILWGSRSVDHVRELIQASGYDAVPVSYEDALAADVIIHSFWFRDILPWAQEHREHLRGKILVDIVNPFTADFEAFTTPWGTSAAEEVQHAVPETRVVGAFKNTFWAVFDEPIHAGLPSDVYVTSDDEAAKQQVLDLLAPLPFRMIDAGALANNRTIERMTLFERELARRYGHYPRVSFRLWGRD